MSQFKYLKDYPSNDITDIHVDALVEIAYQLKRFIDLTEGEPTEEEKDE